MPTDNVIDFSVYTAETEEINMTDVLGKITLLAEEMQRKDMEIAEAEITVKRLKEKRREIAEDKLPELFHSVGQTKLQTRDGLPLTLKKTTRCSIAKARKKGAIEWLDKEGHGGIVKRQVVVNFNINDNLPGEDGSASRVQKLLNLIGKGWKDHKTELDVNASTVKALVTKLLEAGVVVPKETFGIHQFDEVKITSK